MKVVNVGQRTPEWYAWRTQGVSASEIATILGRSPYKTPWRLWAEVLGKVPTEDLSRNPNVRRGVEKEKKARQEYESRHGDILLPVCVESSEMPVFRASLDGLSDTGEPVELKCPAISTYREVLEQGENSTPYKLYWPQVQQQIFVTGAARGYLCFYSDDVEDGEPSYLEFTVQRDDAFIQKELIPKGVEFWNLVLTGKEPAKDPERDIFVPGGNDFGTWERLAEERKFLSVALSSIEAQVKDLKGKLRDNESGLLQLMGNFMRAEACGIRVTRFSKEGAIDYKALLSDLLPDLDDATIEKYRRPGSDQVRITEAETMEAAVADREGQARYEHAILVSAKAEKLPNEGVYAW